MRRHCSRGLTRARGSQIHATDHINSHSSPHTAHLHAPLCSDALLCSDVVVVVQLFVSLIICFITFGFYCAYVPYEDPNDDNLARLCQLEIFFVLLSTIVLRSNPKSEWMSIALPASLLLPPLLIMFALWRDTFLDRDAPGRCSRCIAWCGSCLWAATSRVLSFLICQKRKLRSRKKMRRITRTAVSGTAFASTEEQELKLQERYDEGVAHGRAAAVDDGHGEELRASYEDGYKAAREACEAAAEAAAADAAAAGSVPMPTGKKPKGYLAAAAAAQRLKERAGVRYPRAARTMSWRFGLAGRKRRSRGRRIGSRTVGTLSEARARGERPSEASPDSRG